jgi:PEP-CTERM motif
MKKLSALLPVICLALLINVAHADTLTFNNNPTGEIGPYNLTLNSTPLSLFCMNDQNFIKSGESWGVNVVNGSAFVGSAVGSTGFMYEEEAYIYSQFNGTNATDIQDALWTIFDPGTSNTDANSPSLVLAAAAFNGYTSAFLSNTTFYIWDGGSITNQYGDYAPQDFVGVSQTPEPSSLVLLGSGALGLAGAVRRKLVRS